MKHIPLFVLVLAACSGPSVLPDGGRQRQTCMTTGTTISVLAQDLMGQPLPGATVSAKNTNNGKTASGNTGGDGRTNAVTDDLGDGHIEITAVSGALSTRQPFIVQLTCGECDCTAMPSNATLTLR